MIIIILSLIDPDPVTRLNEIPGAAKLGKIYHFCLVNREPQHKLGHGQN